MSGSSTKPLRKEASLTMRPRSWKSVILKLCSNIGNGGRKTGHLRRRKSPRKSLAILTIAQTFYRGISVSPSTLSLTLLQPNAASPPAPHKLPRRPARPHRYHLLKKAKTSERAEVGLILQGENQPEAPKGPALPADPGKQRRRPPHPSPPIPEPAAPKPKPAAPQTPTPAVRQSTRVRRAPARA